MHGAHAGNMFARTCDPLLYRWSPVLLIRFDCITPEVYAGVRGYHHVNVSNQLKVVVIFQSAYIDKRIYSVISFWRAR